MLFDQLAPRGTDSVRGSTMSVPPSMAVISRPYTSPGVNANGSTNRVQVPGRNPSSVSVFSSTMSSRVRVGQHDTLRGPVDPLVKITAIGSCGSASTRKSSGGPDR